METQLDLFPALPVPEASLAYFDAQRRPVILSVEMAKQFGRSHFHFMRDIDEEAAIIREAESNLTIHSVDSEIEQKPNLTTHSVGSETGPVTFRGTVFFIPCEYVNKRGQTYRAWLITEAGAIVLVERFRGKKLIKLNIAHAFAALNDALQSERRKAEQAVADLRPAWPVILKHNDEPRAEIIKHTGHRSPGSITANRRRMRQVGLLN
jgi:phage regulator Rha-like protein